MIVANEVGSDKTFGKDDNEVWLVTADEALHLDSMPKTELAHKLLDKTLELFH